MTFFLLWTRTCQKTKLYYSLSWSNKLGLNKQERQVRCTLKIWVHLFCSGKLDVLFFYLLEKCSCLCLCLRGWHHDQNLCVASYIFCTWRLLRNKTTKKNCFLGVCVCVLGGIRIHQSDCLSPPLHWGLIPQNVSEEVCCGEAEAWRKEILESLVTTFKSN